MNAVIYARYSPGPQQTEQSIEGQLRECKKYAEAHDISVVGVYTDSAQSGHTSNRTDFQRMIKDAKSGRFEAVIVWKVNRFGRCREEIIFNKAKLRKLGVRVLYTAENIPEGKDGILLESVLEGLAEYQWQTIREDVIRGMTEGAYHCKYNGAGLALGFKIDAEKHYQIDEQKADVVRTVFSMYDSGCIYADIIRFLDEKGIRTIHGKEFTFTGVSRILQNKQYIGVYRWRDIEIADGIPAIVDKELFERVQQRMSKNKKAPARSRGEVDFLLTSKLYCGHCKSPMIGDSGTSRSGQSYYYYTCISRKRRQHLCNKKSVKKDYIERLVVEQTCDYVLRDDVIEYIADRVIEAQKAELADTSMIDYHKNRLKETETAINNIMKAIEQGIITDTTRDRLLQLEADKRDIKADIVREEIVHPEITREQVIFFLEMFKNGNVEDAEYKQRIIDTFIDKIFLYDDRIVITYNYSGENNEVSTELIENAAEEATKAEAEKCSDELSPPPPIENKPNIVMFVVRSVFGIAFSLTAK